MALHGSATYLHSEKALTIHSEMALHIRIEMALHSSATYNQIEMALHGGAMNMPIEMRMGVHITPPAARGASPTTAKLTGSKSSRA